MKYKTGKFYKRGEMIFKVIEIRKEENQIDVKILKPSTEQTDFVEEILPVLSSSHVREIKVNQKYNSIISHIVVEYTVTLEKEQTFIPHLLDKEIKEHEVTLELLQ